jgi:Protein of unknown function (DUF2384)
MLFFMYHVKEHTMASLKEHRPKAIQASPLAGTMSSTRENRSITRFFDQNGIIAIEYVVSVFGMSKTQLAETIGLTREAMYRASRIATPRIQTRATEMLEIISRVSEWAGGDKQAMAWYRSEPLPAFGGRTAEALVKEGHATAVRTYLDHIAMGGFA